MIIFTKFHKEWRKIVDFSLIAKFWVRELFFAHPLVRTHWIFPQSEYRSLGRSTKYYFILAFYKVKSEDQIFFPEPFDRMEKVRTFLMQK